MRYLFTIIIIIIIINSCNDNKNPTKPSEIKEGFRAELYYDGKLCTDKFATGSAEIEDCTLDEDADIWIESGEVDNFEIYLNFETKYGNGVNGYKPGNINYKNFGFSLGLEIYPVEKPNNIVNPWGDNATVYMILWVHLDEGDKLLLNYAFYYSNGDYIGSTGNDNDYIGVVTGEIFEINKERITGELNANGTINGKQWLIKNCQFNLPINIVSCEPLL